MSKTINCIACGRLITYTTRKPKKCAVCKKPVKKPRSSRFPRKYGTKGEILLSQILEKVLPGYDYINNGYYSFMISPKGSPLQLDRYYPELKLAFEYDGKQHDEYVKYLHKARQNFTYLQECDKLKDKFCKARGVTLLRVNHKDKLTEDLIREKILAENEALYRQLFKGE